MKRIVLGILAHVDAGKTTLSEAMLYASGKIKSMGRVDKKNAFLDNDKMEKERGITIFSKQANLSFEDLQIVLLDTPGHVDFSAEMERALQVLDYAVLVVNGADGVQSHTKTLWNLLKRYNIPTFIFVNKMDQLNVDKELIMSSIKSKLADGCIQFEALDSAEFYEEIALCEEALMEEYLKCEKISQVSIEMAIKKRSIFPVYFGSALKLAGVEELLRGIRNNSINPNYPDEFGAKIFKISRDELGNRLTHMKITGGTLKTRDLLSGKDWSEKVNQIRIYSGTKYEAVGEAIAGDICVVTGLSKSRAGEAIGENCVDIEPILEPVLSYKVIVDDDVDTKTLLSKLKYIEEEEPELRLAWNEEFNEITVQLMGEVQLEILKGKVYDRFGISLSFGEGSIVYKETIIDKAEGVGHFEPIRHYAEVHLLLEPAERGSGLSFSSDCSEDLLDKNHQNLILSHLREKEHRGVLTGSSITDIRITLVSGRAHKVHTTGGDFREATYRAVRHGLKETKSILLEPYYKFSLELPENMLGKAMTDIDAMGGSCEIENIAGGIAVLLGSAPVSRMRNYHQELIAYTRGEGRLFTSYSGYETCHNSDEVIRTIGYDSERDIDNPTGSIFCRQGVGFFVPWDQVKNHMHVEAFIKEYKNSDSRETPPKASSIGMSTDEINRIIDSTYYANSGKKSSWRKNGKAKEIYKAPENSEHLIKYEEIKREIKREIVEEYLLVDAYNIIFSWDELYELSKESMDFARNKLLDILSNYQGIKGFNIIVVFDAYKIEGKRELPEKYKGIEVIFTGEAQTADHYIEKFAHRNKGKYKITVATSDGLQQMIIRGSGCSLLSARELREDIQRASEELRKSVLSNKMEKLLIGDIITKEKKFRLKKISEDN